MCGRAEITTDRGAEFENRNLEHELKRLNITKLKISSFNPCSNRIERAHKEIKRLLRLQLHGRNWDMKFKIEIATQKYNNTESKFLSYRSPFSVLFGWEPDILSTVFTIKESAEERDEYNPNADDVNEDIDRWVKYQEDAISSLARDRFQDRTVDYDQLEKNTSNINVGDVVAVKFPQKPKQCSKFHFNWQAPFLVTSKNLSSVRIECLHTRAVYTRNLRLVKKLRLEPEFLDMLKKRNFVVRENYFYPINTTEQPLNDQEITDVNISNTNDINTRVLRSGKKF